MTDCIILAGGLGTRLRDVVKDKPKCLAPVRGKSFLYWLILSLSQRGVNRFFLSLGYGADKVVEEISRWSSSFDISWVAEEKPLGTGGAIKFCMEYFLLNEVLVVNGDTYTDCSLEGFFTPLNLLSGELIRMGTVVVADRTRFGGVEVDKNKRVISFVEKGENTPGIINAGVYLVSIDAFAKELKENFSFEDSILRKLVDRRNVFAELLIGSFIDIGIPEDYESFANGYIPLGDT